MNGNRQVLAHQKQLQILEISYGAHVREIWNHFISKKRPASRSAAAGTGSSYQKSLACAHTERVLRAKIDALRTEVYSAGSYVSESLR